MATVIPNEEGSVDAFHDAWSDDDEAGMMGYHVHDDSDDDDNDNGTLEDNLWMSYGGGRAGAANEDGKQSFRASNPVPGDPSSFAVTGLAVADWTSPPGAVHGEPIRNVVSPTPSVESDDDEDDGDTGRRTVVSNDGSHGEVKKRDLPAGGSGASLLRLPSPAEVGEAPAAPPPPAATMIVEIIGGVHKGKSAILVGRTPKRVAVRLLDDPDPSSKPRYLDPSNVRVEAAAPNARQHHQPVLAVRNAGADQKMTTHAPQGDLVDIVGGVHKGKEAVLVGRTDKRVCVRLLEEGPTSKPRYLLPSNVRVRGADTDAAWDLDEPSPGVSDPRSRPDRGQQQSASCSRARDLTCHLNKFLGFPIQYVHLRSPGEASPLAGTYAGRRFGGRLVEVRIKADAAVGELPRVCVAENGGTYELLVTKLQKSSTAVGGTVSVSRTDVKAIYVLVKGEGVEPIDLQAELSKVAAFYALSPTKAASRLELFCSSARKSTRQGQDFLIFDDLTSSDFEMIPEVANEGCGFCPPSFIQRWLGTHAVGKRTFALQVRVFASRIGIGKGVLMVKPGIERIQLPPSMMKVGPSHLNGPDTAVILVTTNGVFPFPAHLHAACILQGEKPPPKSFVPKRLSPMIRTLLQSIGVPRDVVDEYAEEIQEERGRNLKHASLVGLADPTGKIPSGHVYVTGIRGCGQFGPELFVTRYPCTEKSDGTVWPLLREQPSAMADSDWTFLQSLHFGGIIFGNPLPGQPPMPNMIADGDLDGDLYFVCWHRRILSYVCAVQGLPTGEASEVIDYEFEPSNELVSYEWLHSAQDVMRSISTLVEKHAIIGILFKHMEKATNASDPATAHFFSIAYKEAIDVGKHGGFVTLPRHLWSTVDERFHRYLRDSFCE